VSDVVDLVARILGYTVLGVAAVAVFSALVAFGIDRFLRAFKLFKLFIEFYAWRLDHKGPK
jgi:hypothetical protein